MWPPEILHLHLYLGSNDSQGPKALRAWLGFLLRLWWHSFRGWRSLDALEELSTTRCSPATWAKYKIVFTSDGLNLSLWFVAILLYWKLIHCLSSVDQVSVHMYFHKVLPSLPQIWIKPDFVNSKQTNEKTPRMKNQKLLTSKTLEINTKPNTTSK